MARRMILERQQDYHFPGEFYKLKEFADFGRDVPLQSDINKRLPIPNRGYFLKDTEQGTIFLSGSNFSQPNSFDQRHGRRSGPVRPRQHEEVLRHPDVPAEGWDEDLPTPRDIVAQLQDSGLSLEARRRTICEAELIRFTGDEKHAILELLWAYILENRDSNRTEDLVAVASAIRKYIAIMPMERMDTLVELLEPGHGAPLPLELELEVAKMVYRNFEVHPPECPDPHPPLAEPLWEMARDYSNPRFLLRDKYAAVGSLAVEALVAMRSNHAEAACRTALESPYRWFGEIVRDSLKALHLSWSAKNAEAAQWLEGLEKLFETTAQESDDVA